MYVHFKKKIDRVIAELEIWFNRNDLIINVSKTGVTYKVQYISQKHNSFIT